MEHQCVGGQVQLTFLTFQQLWCHRGTTCRPVYHFQLISFIKLQHEFVDEGRETMRSVEINPVQKKKKKNPITAPYKWQRTSEACACVTEGLHCLRWLWWAAPQWLAPLSDACQWHSISCRHADASPLFVCFLTAPISASSSSLPPSPHHLRGLPLSFSHCRRALAFIFQPLPPYLGYNWLSLILSSSLHPSPLTSILIPAFLR